MPALPHIDRAVLSAMNAAGAMHDAADALATAPDISVADMAAHLDRLQLGWETVGALAAYPDEAVAAAAERGWPGALPGSLGDAIAGAHAAGAALVAKVGGSACDPAVTPAYAWSTGGRPLARVLTSAELSILRTEAAALRDALAWAAA
ncbi:hypothetical protein P2H44_06310 [Albimonas sp. CAU 1670]|uniref:hypothetical protein n=1 Tax=Albimonas sp. CAU 1670 TaxID=3032599 RepID=UPI0023DBFA0D|nr:hypothetical protein [Albimonas sp. CAU 1670]MDF2232162.1 hypothetical protein [Albimonas sp. CAU 1670]